MAASRETHKKGTRTSPHRNAMNRIKSRQFTKTSWAPLAPYVPHKFAKHTRTHTYMHCIVVTKISNMYISLHTLRSNSSTNAEAHLYGELPLTA